MKAGVNMLVPPPGQHVLWSPNDATAKADALRLGLLPSISASLREGTGQRCAAGIVKDGPWLVAIIAWDGFETASDNGWASLSITPACDNAAEWLIGVARTLTSGAKVRMLEGGSQWRRN